MWSDCLLDLGMDFSYLHVHSLVKAKETARHVQIHISYTQVPPSVPVTLGAVPCC